MKSWENLYTWRTAPSEVYETGSIVWFPERMDHYVLV